MFKSRLEPDKGLLRDLRRQVEAFEAEIRDHLRDYVVPMTVVFPRYILPLLVSDLLGQ